MLPSFLNLFIRSLSWKKSLDQKYYVLVFSAHILLVVKFIAYVLKKDIFDKLLSTGKYNVLYNYFYLIEEILLSIKL